MQEGTVFFASTTFVGPREGCVFTRGPLGQGYCELAFRGGGGARPYAASAQAAE